MWGYVWIGGLAFVAAVLLVVGYELYWRGFRKGFRDGEECERSAWVEPGYGIVMRRRKRYHVARIDGGDQEKS